MAYSYYAKITVDNTKVGADESNFPVLVSGTYDSTGSEPDIRTTANGGNIQNTASGGASGSYTVPADLVFSPNTDGSSPYDFEIVKYSASTGEIIAWVEVTSLSSTSDTEFYMVYGDSGVSTSQENVNGTWGNSYAGVWHLNNQLNDSSGSTGSMSNTGAAGSATGGKVCGYYTFGGGESDHMEIDTAAVTAYGFTYECWFYAADVTNNYVLVFCGNKDQGTEFCGLRARGGDTGDPVNAVTHRYGAGQVANAKSTSAFSATTWTYGTATFTSKSARAAFIDGGSKGTDTTTQGTLANHDRTAIGAMMDSTPGYNDADVRIEMVKISSVVRDDDWIATSYETMSDPANFYSMGSESSTSATGFMTTNTFYWGT